MHPANIILLDIIHVLLTSVHDKAGPIIMHKQKSRIRLSIVLYTKFNKSFALYGNIMNQPLNDAIFPTLRKHLELSHRSAWIDL